MPEDTNATDFRAETYVDEATGEEDDAVALHCSEHEDSYNKCATLGHTDKWPVERELESVADVLELADLVRVWMSRLS